MDLVNMTDNSPRTITKKCLISKIAKSKHMHPQDVKEIFQDMLDCITDLLNSGDRFEFRDFGIFETVIRKAKIGRNPKRPEQHVPIPERRGVKFTAGKKLKNLVEAHA